MRHVGSLLAATALILTLSAGWSVAECMGETVDAPPPPPIRVTATVDTHHTRLEVRWQVSNVSEIPLLVFTRPLRHDRTPDPAHAIYVSHMADIVLFSLLAFPLPQPRPGETGVMAAHQMVEAVRLAPGGAVEGHAFFDMPLQTFEPYRSAEVVTHPLPLRALIHVGAMGIDYPRPGHMQQLAGDRFAVYHESTAVALQREGSSGVIIIDGAG